MTDAGSAAEPPVSFEMLAAERVHAVSLAGATDRQPLEALLKFVEEHDMAPFYQHCCARFGLTPDEGRLRAMSARAAENLAKVEARLADAVANLGETEVREALLAKAEHFVHVGDKAGAIAAYAEVEKKTVALGQKMDIQLALMRLCFMFADWAPVREHIKALKALLDSPSGSDWERRNKLKVYEAVYLLAVRDWPAAAELLLQSLSTFTATELFSYRRFIFYTVVVSVVALDRVTLRAKVVDAPEILTVIADIPHAAPLLNGLYECKYAQYMDAYQRLAGTVAADWVLARHARYFAREARLVAYAQFLESYKTVTLARMAEAFGVGADFMDAEVAAFIAAGRLPAKIDRVAGILETTRPNVKNAAYQATIKKGDLLLNRLQRLGRVADL